MDWFANFEMTIHGKTAPVGSRVNVVNPATGEILASAPRATQADLDQAVAAARSAFPAWRDTNWGERARLLTLAGERLMAQADAAGRLFTLEQGRPLAAAIGEVKAGAAWLKSVAGQELPVEIAEDSRRRRVEVRHEPLGVVCAIVPWNFPVLLAMWKIAPALLAGNTIVLKPSPYTPLCMLKIGELLSEVFPPGVLNIVSGDDDLGPWMTAHPGFAKISFTGSTATGRRIMESAAKDLKNLTLELGGNDAAIVMADVDIDSVAPQVFAGAFFNSAQVCVATKRLYVHEAIYDRFRDRLAEIVKSKKLGSGLEAGVDFGPIQNRVQYQRVLALIDEAMADGLSLIQGEAPDGPGYFVPLTLVDNPPDDARVVTEEAFGPVLPIMRFGDVEDVIRRANETDYGLASAVWSADVARAVEIAARLEAGVVWINENLYLPPHTPFGGRKQSGVGVENGVAGLLEFTQSKAIFIPKTTAAA